ncbi:MAG: substrate-binding domain-containing protein [Deltaproteobacteria bacterium]|nr:substrate-binding domain-containing protein [Deltaproteobacteria bacterium]
MPSRRLLLLLLLVLPWPAAVAAADFVVVVNKENPVETLDRSEVKNIFLGKKTFWPNGQVIDVILQDEGEVHQGFVLEILRKTPAQFQLYWKLALFSGTGIPPDQQPDSQAVKAAIAANPKMIGYIDVQQLDDSVKKIELK